MGGIGITFAGHPFDIVKVKMQTAAPGTYSGMLHCASRILKTDGLLGFYRGAAPVFIGVVPIFAMLFWAFGEAQGIAVKVWGGEQRDDLLESSPGYRNGPLVDRLSLTQIGFAGGLSAIPTTVLMGPAERIKILLQIQEKGAVKYKGAVDAVIGVYKTGGLRSLFRGTWLTLVRDSPGSVAYFGIFEAAKRWFQGGDPGKPLGMGVVACGA
jgi:solute carrier family 25 carnitine/acylcarnitine transporter 20/29